ncbi:porin family protein [bacterium]|nr:porin family protein [bacterium]MCB2201532.1 porin family protein [bacterium]
MRSVFVVILALSLVASAGVAQSVAPVPFSIYAGGGVGFPVEPDTAFSQANKMGFGLLAGVGYKFMPMLEGVIKGEYNSFPNDLGGGVEGGEVQINLIGAAVRAGLGVPTASFRPFAMAGFGAAFTKVNEATVADSVLFPETERETSVYFDVGGGLEFSIGPKTTLFAMGRYVYISTEGEPTSYIPVTVGIKIF